MDLSFHLFKIFSVHLIKYSGVFPVGKLTMPSGFSSTHSKNLRDVSNPNFGKLSTIIYGILVDCSLKLILSKKTFSIFEILEYLFN